MLLEITTTTTAHTYLIFFFLFVNHSLFAYPSITLFFTILLLLFHSFCCRSCICPNFYCSCCCFYDCCSLVFVHFWPTFCFVSICLLNIFIGKWYFLSSTRNWENMQEREVKKEQKKKKIILSSSSCRHFSFISFFG